MDFSTASAMNYRGSALHTASSSAVGYSDAPLALSWCCQRWNGVRYNLFLRLLCANWGMINTKTKSCIKKPQTPSNLMEMTHNKANLWCKMQPCLKQYEQSSNFPCKVPALALVFVPLRKVIVVKGTLSTNPFIILMCYSWSFSYFCKPVLVQVGVCPPVHLFCSFVCGCVGRTYIILWQYWVNYLVQHYLVWQCFSCP